MEYANKIAIKLHLSQKYKYEKLNQISVPNKTLNPKSKVKARHTVFLERTKRETKSKKLKEK